MPRPAAVPADRATLTPAELAMREQARLLIEFCDGLEEGGWVEYPARSRVAARNVIRLVEQLEAERSARVAVQEARDRAVELLGRRAREAIA